MWIYYTLSQYFPFDDEDFKEAGEAGWELVSGVNTPYSRYSENYYAYFKQRKPQ